MGFIARYDRKARIVRVLDGKTRRFQRLKKFKKAVYKIDYLCYNIIKRGKKLWVNITIQQF